VPQVLCPALVGRDEEARRLRAALAAAEAGRGGAVFLAGEAGIGKSRLVREAVRAAGERGLTVLVLGALLDRDAADAAARVRAGAGWPGPR